MRWKIEIMAVMDCEPKLFSELNIHSFIHFTQYVNGNVHLRTQLLQQQNAAIKYKNGNGDPVSWSTITAHNVRRTTKETYAWHSIWQRD